MHTGLFLTIRRMSNLPYHGLHKFVKKTLVIHVPQHDLKSHKEHLVLQWNKDHATFYTKQFIKKLCTN